MEELKPGVYRHFKGKDYRLLYVARHSETEEEMVVYQALYGERGIWVRPAAMWNETVERDGRRVRPVKNRPVWLTGRFFSCVLSASRQSGRRRA